MESGIIPKPIPWPEAESMRVMLSRRRSDELTVPASYVRLFDHLDRPVVDATKITIEIGADGFVEMTVWRLGTKDLTTGRRGPLRVETYKLGALMAEGWLCAPRDKQEASEG